MGDEEFYEPGEVEVHDHGGWTGGEFTLGSGGAETVVSSAGGSVPAGSLSRREVLAKAAEARMKRVEKADEETGSARGKS